MEKRNCIDGKALIRRTHYKMYCSLTGSAFMFISDPDITEIRCPSCGNLHKKPAERQLKLRDEVLDGGKL